MFKEISKKEYVHNPVSMVADKFQWILERILWGSYKSVTSTAVSGAIIED